MVDPINSGAIRDTDGVKLSFTPKSAQQQEVSTPFVDVLKQSVMRVNEMQVYGDKMTQRLALGEVEDISEVSIAVEKAELALRMMVQIRDKLVDAYQQIARMSV